MRPKVSVCIPTYNRAATLLNAINYIKNQTYNDYEIIIADDASTDNTCDVVTNLSDKNIRYYKHEKNKGIFDNWNFLIQQARGEYVAIYHDHDIYLPTILEKSIEILDAEEDVIFVHTAFVLIDNKNQPMDVFVKSFDKVVSGQELQNYFLSDFDNDICAATVMVRKSAYQRVVKYDNSYGLGSDKKMWFELSKLGSVGYVKEPQALILGRSQNDPTDKFNLKDYTGMLNILNEILTYKYNILSKEYAITFKKLKRQMEYNIYRRLLRSVITDNHETTKKYHSMAKSELKYIHNLIVYCIISNRMFKNIISKFLSNKYRNILRVRRKRVIEYINSNSNLSTEKLLKQYASDK